MAVNTEETVSVSLTKEEIDLILGAFEETEFSDEPETDEDEDGETIEVGRSEATIAEELAPKLRNAAKQFG